MRAWMRARISGPMRANARSGFRVDGAPLPAQRRNDFPGCHAVAETICPVPGGLAGLFFLQQYRSLTIMQFATAAGAATGKGPALRMAANRAATEGPMA